MPQHSDNHDPQGEPRVHRDGHSRRMEELEQELELARKQAEIERARAEAVVTHLATENHELRNRHSQAPARVAPEVRRSRGNALWRLAGHLVARIGSAILSLISCAMFLLLALLVYAYWPELSAMFGSALDLQQ